MTKKKTSAQLDREINAALNGGSGDLKYRDPEIERMFKKSGSKGTIGDHDKTVAAVLGDTWYTRRFKMPKWNIQPTALTSPDVAIRHWHELGVPTSKSAHAQRADHFRDLKQRFDAEHGRLIDEGERLYGKNGSLIAGGFREDWPAAIKDRIRFVASGSGILSDAIRLHEALSKTRSPAFR